MRVKGTIRTNDALKIAKNYKEKSEKESQALIQLMDLPDFDISQFIQTLLKSQRYEELLQRIPAEKKIDFFSKNYQSFLETQDEIFTLQLPELQEIPKAKNFIFQQEQQKQESHNMEQALVLQTIDSFSSAVLQKNTEETLRTYNFIQDMKKHSKYRLYFSEYSTHKIFIETYNTFIDNCNSYETLLKINEYDKAILVYFRQKQKILFEEMKTNLNINDNAASMGKEMSKLVHFMEDQIKSLRIKFKKEIQKNDQLNALICDWIIRLAKNFYLLVQSYIYQKEQLSEILQILNVVLQASTELQSKGITLQRQIKEYISKDLPNHISKVIQIIVESLNQILKENNDLYEFVYFSSIKKFSTELSNLKIVPKQQFGKKCATCKGIILVNSFILILQTICDEKWEFLYEGIIQILLEKVALQILNCTLHYWDYYYIFQFFERLAAGKLRHKELFKGQPKGGLADKLVKIKRLSEESWSIFQSKVYGLLFNDILRDIPSELYNFGKYGYNLQKLDSRPSPLSIKIIFNLEQFIRQIQFRTSSSQFQYLSMVFFEYILFTFEYVLLWSYHSKGTNDKVFILYSKQQKLLKKIKEFNFLQIQEIKSNRIFAFGRINKFGLYKLAFEVYFLAEVYKIITGTKKIDVEPFNLRLAKILAKQTKKDLIDVSKAQFQDSLAKMIKIYKEKPQLMQSYLAAKTSQQRPNSKQT